MRVVKFFSVRLSWVSNQMLSAVLFLSGINGSHWAEDVLTHRPSVAFCWRAWKTIWSVGGLKIAHGMLTLPLFSRGWRVSFVVCSGNQQWFTVKDGKDVWRVRQKRKLNFYQTLFKHTERSFSLQTWQMWCIVLCSWYVLLHWSHAALVSHVCWFQYLFTAR